MIRPLNMKNSISPLYSYEPYCLIVEPEANSFNYESGYAVHADEVS